MSLNPSVGPILKPSPQKKAPRPLRSKPHVIAASLREAVLERDGRTCQFCEVPGGALDLHHRQARSAGGRDELSNLVSLHRLCHAAVHARPAEARRRGLIVGMGVKE